MTTIRTPHYEIGSSAASLLINSLQGCPDPSRMLDLGFALIKRDSA
ncbi:MAG: hypothetical protein HRU05_16035 [Oceanospirillaceae bacterium]|nr:hypothetical protein [Oceanospirillaceae bacterium]